MQNSPVQKLTHLKLYLIKQLLFLVSFLPCSLIKLWPTSHRVAHVSIDCIELSLQTSALQKAWRKVGCTHTVNAELRDWANIEKTMSKVHSCTFYYAKNTQYSPPLTVPLLKYSCCLLVVALFVNSGLACMDELSSMEVQELSTKVSHISMWQQEKLKLKQLKPVFHTWGGVCCQSDRWAVDKAQVDFYTVSLSVLEYWTFPSWLPAGSEVR